MNSDVPNIPGKRSLPTVKPLRGRAEERGSIPQTLPVNAIEFPEDQVQLSRQVRTSVSEMEELAVSQEELDRYVANLKDMPDEVLDSGKIDRVRADLADGRYGREALQATVEGLGRDLGVFS